MSVSRCKQEVISTEFVRWQKYFEIRLNRPSLICMYIAALRADLAAMFSSKKLEIKIEDFFLKFLERSAEDLKKVASKLEKIAARFKIDPKEFTTVEGSLAFFKSLDYKKNPVPKEDFSQTELWKFDIRQASLKKLVNRAQKRKEADRIGPDGKIIPRRRGRRERTPFESMKNISRKMNRLDELIDKYPLNDDPPATS